MEDEPWHPPDDEDTLPCPDRPHFHANQMLRVLFRLAMAAPETVRTVALARQALRAEDVTFTGSPTGCFSLMDNFGDDVKFEQFKANIEAGETLALTTFFSVCYHPHCGEDGCCGPAPLLHPYEPYWVQSAREGKLAKPYEEDPNAVYGDERYKRKGTDGPVYDVYLSSSDWVEDEDGNGRTVDTVQLNLPGDDNILTMEVSELRAEWDRVYPNQNLSGTSEDIEPGE